jgi:hypothetical protein
MSGETDTGKNPRMMYGAGQTITDQQTKNLIQDIGSQLLDDSKNMPDGFRGIFCMARFDADGQLECEFLSAKMTDDELVNASAAILAEMMTALRGRGIDVGKEEVTKWMDSLNMSCSI